MTALSHTVLRVVDYDLAATLDSGQAFRWTFSETEGWEGIVGRRWVRLRQVSPERIEAFTLGEPGDWRWLTDYLQTQIDLAAVLASFPSDEPMRAAIASCRGLRLLRQEPWECLASFICSSTKQITQIRQIVAAMSDRFGEEVLTPSGVRHAFPTASRVASLTEADLRACKLGFRAPYVLAAARAVDGGALDLEALWGVSLDEARAALIALPGVGRKIADCVLLFAYGFPGAFPVDVWVARALRELYFPKRRPTPERLRRFTQTHFGPHAGFAQQYLFHHMRTRRGG